MLISISKWLLLGTFFSILIVSKDFTNSNFGLRPEDFLSLAVILLLPLLVIKNSLLVNRKILITILIYFTYVLVISFTQNPSYILNILVLYLKELSYFGYFLIAFSLAFFGSREQISRFFKTIFFFCIPSIVYIGYQLFIGGSMGMYGVTFYGHSQSPASAGLISLTICYMSFLYSQLYKEENWIWIFLLIFSAIVLLTGSKIATVGLFTFFIANILLEKRKKQFIVNIFLLLLAITILMFAINSGIGSLHRLQAIFSPIDVILERGIWFKINWIDGFVDAFFGSGIATGHIRSDSTFSYGMAMDNQFLYFLIVLGIIGTSIFMFLLFLLVYFHPKKSIQRRIQISLIVSYFFMGMGAEVFQLSISGIIFWTMSGLLIGFSKRSLITKENELI